MQTGDQRQVIVERLSQHSEYIEEVVGWIHREWGTNSKRAIKKMLSETDRIPPALVAIGSGKPVGVLGYKLHALEPAGDIELWINVLYVEARWRRSGIGSRLLKEGVNAAMRSGRSSLCVYTDNPEFYEHRGWSRFSYNEKTEMYILVTERHLP